MEQFSRTEILLGKENMDKLKNFKVAVFGVGGVGSFAAEALVRTGLGNIVLIDYDIIDVSNINRQVHANLDTVGQEKVVVMKDRLLKINPELNIEIHNTKYSQETKDLIRKDYDYVIDAIDMVSSKLSLVTTCKSMNIPIISAMGAGNKLDPTKLQVGDIKQTHTCPLARVIRRELKKKSIENLKVVWSPEQPIKTGIEMENLRKAVPGSVAYVPPVCGFIIASEVIKDLIFGGE